MNQISYVSKTMSHSYIFYGTEKLSIYKLQGVYKLILYFKFRTIHLERKVHFHYTTAVVDALGPRSILFKFIVP